MLAHKVYRFRIQPNAVQADALCTNADARRFVYNWAVGRRKEHYAETQTTLSIQVLSLELTQLKKQSGCEWIASVDSQLLQQALRDADRAYRNFFRTKKGFPRFKSRFTDTMRFRIPQRVTITDGYVFIPKLGKVRIYQSQTVEGETKSASFKRDVTGKWYVTLTVQFEIPDTIAPVNPDTVIGIDLGIKTFAVLSTGEEVANPKFYRKGQKKLRRAQRKLSRSQRHSANRTKARRKVALVHRKVANQRNDFLHKLTTALVAQYGGFCIENLNVKGMVKNHHLAKSIGDASFGEFRRQLEYKALWAGKPVAAIDRWFPSSKTCGSCEVVNKDLALSDRTWTCVCGVTHDRDVNAARNIRIEGLKMLVAAGHVETQNARGVDVRPLEANDGEARIPPL